MAEKKTSEPILQEALERFEDSQDGSDFNRNDAYDDIRFARLADQWPKMIRDQREEEGRPCLTVNRMPAFIRQVVNDARQSKPGIQVHPVDNGADVETAEVINGIVRSIERRSQASIAYDTAIDHAVSGGFGFFRIGIDYAHENTFDMECYIERVANPLMVHWDVNSTEFDASDWDYGFVSDFLTEEEFERKYPDASQVSFEGDSRDHVTYWLDDDKIRVAEYWLREFTPTRLLQLNDGTIIREDHITPDLRALVAHVGVRRERIVEIPNVKRRIVSGVEVLEEDDWPGSTIPICPVWGEEVISDGRRHFRSMIRDAADPQRMFNFWRSASTELVALAPKAPWVGPEGFVPDDQIEKWATANTRSHAYLEYDKNAGAAPQRQPFAGVPAGAIQEALNAADDMKAIIGIYDSSLGARSNETSGRAIMARQREADTSNFHFIDNLNRAIEYAGRVLVEIIPYVYTDRETVRILGEDEAETVARLGERDYSGEERLYDLQTGKYDVTVKSGPSYATQREETRETLIEIMRNVPGSAQYIGDVLLEHMDFQGSDKVANRLKLLLPPNVQAAEGIANPGAPQVQPEMPPAQTGIPAAPGGAAIP